LLRCHQLAGSVVRQLNTTFDHLRFTMMGFMACVLCGNQSPTNQAQESESPRLENILPDAVNGETR
jgi:hypothetical protein